MSHLVSEITFAGMPRKTDGSKPAPSAANMPGWKAIAEGVRDAVETSGISVSMIAERTGLTRQYVYSMMSGTCNPSMDKVEAVFKAAGVSFEAWINDRSLYGRDKRLHDQLQFLLNQKGTNAVAARRTLEALLAYSADNSSEVHQ